MQGSVGTRGTGGRGLPAAAPGSASAMLGGGSVLRAADVDVGQARERRRQRRLTRLAVVLWVTTLAVWWRVPTGGSLNPLDGLRLGPDAMLWLPAVLIVVLIAVVMVLPMLGQGRSPHLTYRPEQIEVGLDDVKGLGPLRDEVTRPSTCSSATPPSRTGSAATRGGASCSRASPAPARPRWPRRCPPRRGAVPVRVRDQLPVDVVRHDRPQDPGLLQGAAQGGPPGGRGHRLHRGDRRHRWPPGRARRRRRRPGLGWHRRGSSTSSWSSSRASTPRPSGSGWWAG